MGSLRSHHSNGRKAARSRPRKTKTRPKTTKDAFLDAAGWLAKAVSIIATASKALIHAQQETGTLKLQDAGEQLITLEHGVRYLRVARLRLDEAILGLSLKSAKRRPPMRVKP